MGTLERYDLSRQARTLETYGTEPAPQVIMEFDTVRDTLGRGKHKVPEYDRVLQLGCAALDDFQFTFPHSAEVGRRPRKKYRVAVERIFAQRNADYILGHYATGAEPQPLIEGASRLWIRNCLGYIAAMEGCPLMAYDRTRVHLEEQMSYRRVSHKEMRHGNGLVMGYESTSQLLEEKGRPSASFHGGVILRKGSRSSRTLLLQCMATGGMPGISTLPEMVSAARAIAPTIPQEYWHKGARPLPEEIHPYRVEPWGFLASR